MSSNNAQLKKLFGVSLAVILGLSILVSVATMTEDAPYIAISEDFVIDTAVSNSTTTTQIARNDSITYEYFDITLNATSVYGLTTIEEATNITYTVSTKELEFKEGVLNASTNYLASVDYYYARMGDAGISLVALVPLLFVVLIIAVVMVFVKDYLDKMKPRR